MNFTEFKKDFYSRVDNPELFKCANFNAIKIVLDGLKVQYNKKGKVKAEIISNYGLYRIKNFVKQKLNKSKPQKSLHDLCKDFFNPDILIIDDGRFVLNSSNECFSYYFDNIAKALSDLKLMRIAEKVRNPAFPYDLYYEQISNIVKPLAENDYEKKLLSEIRLTYKRIEDSKIFIDSELENIAFAFQNFFLQFKCWYRFLSLLRPKRILFICHYHKEGLIYACRELGILIDEMQHGLISEKDIFYVLPEKVKNVLENSLFANRIFVFGQYWKQVLLQGFGYNEEQIIVAGYYLYKPAIKDTEYATRINQFKAGRKSLLVTTQTFLHDYFNDYLIWLSEEIKQKYSDWCIIVKNHPLEPAERYKPICNLSNLAIFNIPLEELFPESDLHLSIYSTTLFDALRYGVKNFSLIVPQCADYTESIIKEGIATGIGTRENPLENLHKVKQVSPDFYYSDFSAAKFRNLMQNA